MAAGRKQAFCVCVCWYQRDRENFWPLICTDTGFVCNRAGAGGKLDANAELSGFDRQERLQVILILLSMNVRAKKRT